MGRSRGCAVLAVASCVVGCSLLTDLGGLSGSQVIGEADARPSEDGAIEAGGDGPVSVGPYVPRFERGLEIANPGSTPLPGGYTTCFRASPQELAGSGFDAKLRSDAADLRVFSTGVELRRVVDVLRTGIVSVCFRLVRSIAPGAADKTYVLRYGDANALAPPPALGDVFDFFDDFDGTSLAPGWRKFGAPVVSGGAVTLPKGTPSGIATVSDIDGVKLDTSLEIRAAVTNPSSDGQLQGDAGADTYYYWFGFQRQGDFDPIPPWSVFIARSKSVVNAEHFPPVGSCMGCSAAGRAQLPDARVYRIDRAGDAVVFRYDDGFTVEAAGSAGDLSVLLRNFLVDSDVVVDWVRARPLVVPEPVPIVGPEVVLK